MAKFLPFPPAWIHWWDSQVYLGAGLVTYLEILGVMEMPICPLPLPNFRLSKMAEKSSSYQKKFMQNLQLKISYIRGKGGKLKSSTPCPKFAPVCQKSVRKLQFYCPTYPRCHCRDSLPTCRHSSIQVQPGLGRATI